MPPVKTAVPPQAVAVYEAYLACLAARGAGNKTFESSARCFLARFPDPQAWAGLPLAARLAGTRPHLQPLLNFLMLHGHLRPGYDYLLEGKLTVILREAAASPLGPDLNCFLAGAETLAYSVRARTGMASEVAIRVLIQTGRALTELTDADFTEFGQAVTEREARLGRAFKHYHHALYASRAVIYHLGAPAEPVPKRSTLGRWSWNATWTGSPRSSCGRWWLTWNGCRARTPAPRCRARPLDHSRFRRQCPKWYDGLRGESQKWDLRGGSTPRSIGLRP